MHSVCVGVSFTYMQVWPRVWSLFRCSPQIVEKLERGVHSDMVKISRNSKKRFWVFVLMLLRFQFHRNSDFCQKLFFSSPAFFLNSFSYSLIYFHFLHHNQVIECLGCAFGMFIIHCNHETLQLFTWISPVCLTLFRRFALRGPAPADSLKRTPSRRSCKHH